MLDVIRDKLKQHTSHISKYNYLREYLQLLILKKLDEKGYFRNLAFVGGTALRILYDLKRFSEDLDFCLTNQEHYSFAQIMKTLEHELKQENLSVDITYKDNKAVASAFIKFTDLLFALDISAHKDQRISIKFEVDQNPPLGFQTTFTMINKEFLIGINHYDMPSLYAGKLHAILCRSYAKGRDYYDLIWYIARKAEPNYLLLEQAISQTQGKQLALDAIKLKELLRARIIETDFKKVRRDIEPFLVESSELRYFEKDFFLNLVNQIGP